jgi:chromosome segregation ATPase
MSSPTLTEYESKLAKARGELKEAESKLEKAEGKLKDAKAELKDAKTELEVATKANNNSAIAIAEKAIASAHKAIASAEKAIARAEHEVDDHDDRVRTLQLQVDKMTGALVSEVAFPRILIVPSAQHMRQKYLQVLVALPVVSDDESHSPLCKTRWWLFLL